MKRRKRATLQTRNAPSAPPVLRDDDPRQAMDSELAMRAWTVRAESLDPATRSVEAVLSTENPVPVYDWARDEVIDEVLRADGVELSSQMRLLESHNRWNLDAVLGSIRNMRIEGNQLIGRLYFAEGDERAEKAWAKVRQGHLTDVSIGYVSRTFTDIMAGQSGQVGGRQYQAGKRTLRITTSWKPREGSLVSIGADDMAKIRAADPPRERTTTMNPRLKAYLVTLGLRAEATDAEATRYLETVTEAQRAFAATLTEPSPAAPPAPPAPAPERTATPAAVPAADDVAQRAVAAERERTRQIRELAGAEIPAELVQRALDDGWDTARASTEFLRALRQSRPASVPAIQVRDHDRDCDQRSLAAGLRIRLGLTRADARLNEGQRQVFDRDLERGSRYRDMALIDICREALRMERITLPESRHEQIRAAVSTAALSHIFTTNVGAALLQAWDETPDSTMGWCRERDVPNFLTQERTALGKSATLERLPRGKEAKHATRSTAQETYKAYRFANQFVVDEQDIIDDALNALVDMPNELGAAARRVRPDLVYSILLANANMSDGNALFVASPHANYGTSSTALAASTLEAAIKAMAIQTDNGVPLNIRAAFLITPPDLAFTARVLLQSEQRVVSSSGGTLNPLLAENITPVSDARISTVGVRDPVTNTAYAGTATNWFLAASPSTGRTIEVGYVAGTGRLPVLRSFVLDQGRWGLGWDIKLDIGAKALDWRGLYKATGAS